MDEVVFDGSLYKPVSKMGFELSQLLCRLCLSEKCHISFEFFAGIGDMSGIRACCPSRTWTSSSRSTNSGLAEQVKNYLIEQTFSF